MTTTHVTFKYDSSEFWTDEPFPGPQPQATTRQYPTARTYCTCGHNGPSHRRQTSTTAPHSQARPMVFRGDCKAWVRHMGDWVTCPCTWFFEQPAQPVNDHGDYTEGGKRLDLAKLADDAKIEKARLRRVKRLEQKKNSR